ncbi:MAG: thioredoxin [Clostridia bacterium]|nr:thioredoxin [Clostridia bacterium]
MKQANDNNFNELVNEDKLTVVDFYATWCMPCQMQAKVLEKLDSSRSDEYDIIKVNVDEAPNLASIYEVYSIPTLVMLKNGEILRKSVGYTEEKELLSMIEELK